MTPELETALADLDLRAMLDPRLEVYRVAPGSASPGNVPRGWQMSEDMAHLVEHRGWWPGYFADFEVYDPVPDWFDDTINQEVQRREHTIQWGMFGSVHDGDICFTPVTRSCEPSAPVFMSSSQALWNSMTFATEASMLRAFIISYDEIGWDDESDSIETMFVDWMIEPPKFHVTPQQRAAHERLKSLTDSTTSSHPSWDPAQMPFFANEQLPAIAQRLYGLR